MILPLVPRQAAPGFVPGFSPPDVLLRTADGLHGVAWEDQEFTHPDGRIFLIPKGAKTDGASTPQWMWNILPPVGKLYWMACRLHDALYQLYGLTEQECNEILLVAMQVSGVNAFEAKTIFDGVKEWGLKSFEEDRKNQGGITQ